MTQKEATKERPIIFSAPMVRAILDGRKKQTRRIVKLREFGRSETRGYDFIFRDRRGLWNDYSVADLMRKVCPYGAPGDRLWVRETFGLPSPCRCGTCEPLNKKHVSYRADYTGERFVDRWRPSIFMPRWASRITLEIVSVRVERLNNISEEDARAEGVADCAAYKILWNKINGPGKDWKSNPWVWVIEFKLGARE